MASGSCIAGAICWRRAKAPRPAAIFIAQLYGIDLSLTDEIILVLTLMVTSKGIAGVPGVSFVVLLATLGSVGIPLEGLAFIAGVDRIMDMARTALNVIGNALAVLVISRWEGMYDDAKGARYWNSHIKKLLLAKSGNDALDAVKVKEAAKY